MIEIEEGALFIADSHYPTHGTILLKLLQSIDRGDIDTPQLFLMGDICDLLVGGLEKSYEKNREAIDLIESISKNISVYYFEGNHDFQLQKIFTNIKIFTRANQPQYMTSKDRIYGLSHGDRYAIGWKHEVLSILLRNSIVLKTIKALKPNIIKEKNKHLSTKNICHPIANFEQKTRDILANYREDCIVIEGHYHQRKVYDRYISLPSLVCQNEVGIMNKNKIKFVSTEELIL